MCGIVGYIGPKNCVPIILEGLKRLEYRGYDSAGIALVKDSKITVVKKAGKVVDLVGCIAAHNGEFAANLGMGHTRWATHGEPNDINAHPHFDQDKHISIIHNGIIENYQSIKTKLLREGHVFTERHRYRGAGAPDWNDVRKDQQSLRCRSLCACRD